MGLFADDGVWRKGYSETPSVAASAFQCRGCGSRRPTRILAAYGIDTSRAFAIWEIEQRDRTGASIVASESGGLVRCDGGNYRLADGRGSVKALSCDEVSGIVTQLDQLNPYDRDIVTDPILKIEKVNLGPDRKQRPLYGYAIAAKRYVLFSRDEHSDL